MVRANMKKAAKKSLAAALIMLSIGSLSACKSPEEKSGTQLSKADSFTSDQQTNKNDLDGGMLHDVSDMVNDRVFFDLDKTVVRNEGKDVLNRWAAFLKKNPKDQLLIEGHCDERGTREYNLALGDRRANSVKEFLIGNGIQADRVRIISYGKERPAEVGSDDSAYAKNRRAVALVQ